MPPRCLGCGESVGEQGTLCTSCWPDITYITSPECHQCGLPFEHETVPGVICADCSNKPPEYDQARAVFKYTPQSARLIARFKYYDHTHAATTYGRWLHNRVKPLLEQTDIIAPIPLHPRRLISRRYNQAALLTSELHRHSRVMAVMELIKRVRHIPPQASLTKRQRHWNVKNAFDINPKYRSLLQDKNIMLVDDVMTTGATVNECAKILKAQGAGEIYVATLARTIE